MLERLAGNEYYCFLDVFSGYFQIPIDPQYQEKTTVTCPYGTFAYRRMPFGLCNALCMFQRCMMAIFHDMIVKMMEVFMDDFSEKSHFMVKEGIVLVHKISKNRIEVDKAKVDVITKLPHPTTVKGVRSFLGHAGFYHRFIQDFSKIARPMTRLLEKDTLFIFSKECIKSFQSLKKKLTKAPILVASDWDIPFELMCDVCDFAIGAVLGQRKTKQFQPIHYASKTMTDAQAHYTTSEKELLAVVEKYCNVMKCLKMPSNFARFSTYEALIYGAVPVFTREQTDDELTEKELKQIEADTKLFRPFFSAKLFNEWERFTSNEGESIESYYHRFLKLMNDLKRNKHFPKKIASNLKFLNNLQPEWSRHVTIVHQTKDLHTANYTQLYDFLKYNQKEVDELKSERLAKIQDPLALMANSYNPYAFPAPHKDQPSYNQNCMQQPMLNPEDITDPTTAMNMALALMAKAFKLNYSTPTNNNHRISSNPHNRQIAQPGNLNGYNAVQNVRNQVAQNLRVQNVRNHNGLIVTLGNANLNGNGTLVAARAEGNVVGPNDGSAEVHDYENCDDNEIFNMFTQEEQYTELLKPIPDQHQVPHNDNNVIYEVTSVEQSGETVEQHPCDECKYDKISYDKAYKDMQQNIERLQAQLGDLKGKSKDTSCVSDTLNPLSQKLKNETVELEFQVLNYARENAHLKATYKNLFDFNSVSHTQTKTIIASLQNELQNTIYENAKLRSQLFKRVFVQKENTCGTSKNTKFAKQSILGKPPMLGEIHASAKPVTSNSVPTPQESKVVKNDKVIALGMFRINPFKTSMDEKHVPNNIRASARTKPITTRRPQPRSNTKNYRVPSASKSSQSKNKGAEVEEHHRNLLLSKNTKHMSSACNNIKLDSHNVISKVVYAMCKQCLVFVNHDVCLRNYVNGKTSSGKKQKKHQPKAMKTKKVGFIERLATPKPRKPGFLLRWSPTGRLFDQKGKIVDSNESKSQSDRSNGDNACTSNTLEPKIKRFPNSTSLLGRVYFVEGLGHNLFSVGQFYDSDLEVAFRRNACFVRNLEGVDLLKGDRSINLYTINLHEMASASPICLMARASSTKSWLWHQRLSHLNFDTINDLVSDFCGPMRIDSINGKRYVLVIVDGYARYTWAKAIATACFTQNRSIIYRHFNKTPYELINGRKPDISFLHVFGDLGYPKNDREDIGKLGAKGDIGFFIGYFSDSCAYRIYNRRTKKIVEIMNVSFDELLTMSFEQRSSKPVLQSMTSGQISSGLDLTYAPSTIKTQQPTKGELDLLFEAMYDDYIGGQPSTAARTVSPAQEPQVCQTSTISTTIADTVPPPTNSSLQLQLFQTLHKMLTSLIHNSNRITLWNKLGEPSRPILARNQLRSDGDMCMYALTVSTMEPKNVKEAMPDPAWVDSMRFHDDILVVQVYVDGIIFGSTHPRYIQLFSNLMKSRFEMSMSGEMMFFLSLQVNQSPCGIFINQSKYMLEILKKYGMESCDPVSTPMEIKDKMDLDQNGTPVDAMKYRSMIGALMYLTSSRPDIVHATCLCARYQAKPTEKHLKEVKRIFRYLKGTINMGLWYTKDSGFEVTGFSDVDYARFKDTFKSTSDGAQFLGEKLIQIMLVVLIRARAHLVLVSWSSKKQDCTSMSSAEVEYVSLSACCAQVLWMRTQLTDYGFHFDKIPMYCDSKEAIAISCNPV
nr:reverse transcriptase domain-containing protein [Tanacetum cinerariifolium]